MTERRISYENPPVVERVIGVQFAPLKDLTAGLLGRYWATLDHEEWPTSTDADELPPQFERFDDAAFPLTPQAIRMQFSSAPRLRIQIRNAKRDRLIQVQNGRFHLNWTRSAAEAGYPEYPVIKEEFLQHWSRFCGFIRNCGMDNPIPNQWEVTYLNHIPQDTVWKEPADWGFLTALNPIQPTDDLFHLRSFEGEWHFEIPDNKGRLHVRWRHSTGKGGKGLIALTITARGGLNSDSIDEVVDGIDLGHSQIVRSFRAMMSDQANRIWGLRHEDQ